MPSKGFMVDTLDRNDVLSFYHAIHKASEGYEDRINWTGNYTSQAGTVSNEFVRDVERRVNYYRAMAGAAGDAVLNTAETVNIFASDAQGNRPPEDTKKWEASQQAAYMVARARMNGQSLNHNPSSSTTPAWTTAAWNGAARGNFTYGYFGPGAIDAYMREYEATSTAMSSDWNRTVGHRRWILFSRAKDFATGDTPGEFIYPNTKRYASNALYVVPKAAELKPAEPEFVIYPSSGYFPAPLNTPYWSAGFPGGIFTNALVEMRDGNGALVETAKVTQTTTEMGRGDPSIVWEVKDPAAKATSVEADRTYSITISGIGGAGVPSTLSYSVTLINPERINSDQNLTGSVAPPATGSASYFLTPPAQAEAIQVNVFNSSSSIWTETAEAGSPSSVIDQTYGNYTFLSSAFSGVPMVSGNRSFRLTHPVRYDIMVDGVPEQTFEIDREILTNAGAASTLNFKYKKGYMLAASRLTVEYTQDNGGTWMTLGSPIQGVGTDTMIPDASAINWAGTLPKSPTPYRVRFRFHKSSDGNTFNHQEPTHANLPTGIFIDDITTTNCNWYELKKSNTFTASADRFIFNAASAGGPIAPGTEYHLRMRTKLGNRWFLHGAPKIVTTTATPLTNFNGWFAYEYPTLTGGFTGDHDDDGIPNSIEYAFLLDPLLPSVSKDSVGFQSSVSKDATGPYMSITRAANGIRDGVTAEWSETLAPGSWSSQDVTVTYSAVNHTATAVAPTGSGKRFLRWKVTIP